MSYYFAIDVGGTFIKYGHIHTDGRLTFKDQTATPLNEDGAILKKVKEIITKHIEEKGRLLGIGISTAGVVDSDSGEIIYTGPTIKNYRGTNFKANIEADFQIPVQVHNDVNAALLGEQWQGAAKDQSDVYCITLGTGIGGAYFRDQLVTGASFKAGEIGYLLYDAKTDTTYEQRASTSALKQKAKKKNGRQVNGNQHHKKEKEHN